VTLLLAVARLLLSALFGATSLVGDHGLATRFGDPGDHWAGAELSCTRQKLSPGQLVCAHRTLPCGSLVMIHNPRSGRFAVCEVLDRGPFGAVLPDGAWGLKIRKSEPGDWRGIIDLSPAVADALDFNGREPVHLVYQRVARHLRAGREAPPTAHH
jgi:rare lipoprotein A (peptidoglycan hydrolase)